MPDPADTLPHLAEAVMDIRLPRTWDVGEVLRAMRARLDGAGFSDVEMDVAGAYDGSSIARDAPVLRAAEALYGAHGVETLALAVDGRLVCIAFLRGMKTELDVNELMRRRLTLSGSTLRPRTVEFKGAIAASLRSRIWPLIEAGRIKPVIFKTFPLEHAAEAHRLMESSAHIGKIVLTL